MSTTRNDFDASWKSILDPFFQEFLALCCPEIYRQIDWKKGYKSRDKELNKIAKNDNGGNRIADKLFEVFLKNGQETFILIHLEIQGNKVLIFEERMFVYFYKLRNFYQKPVISLALLVDKNANWRPSFYKESLLGTTVEFKFSSIKLLDFKNRIEILESSRNPFAVVILVYLEALKKTSYKTKLDIKANLTRRLYKKDFSKETIIQLYNFLDCLVYLPPPFDIQYDNMVQEIEEELNVRYISTAERFGFERGRQQGESQMLVRQLLRKFKINILPEDYNKKIEQADADTLLKWGERVVEVSSFEEVFEN